MNLIEKLGGCEAVKAKSESNILYGEKIYLKRALLEHRRAKNIIEVGDKVFLDETGDEIQTVTERNKELFYNLGFTHATDIEIAQGYRS